MDVSKFLSKVMGIYLVIISAGMLIQMDHFVNAIVTLMHEPSLTLVTGFLTLILGITLVVCHNHWEWNWRLLITIFAWLILLKGFSLIFYPQLLIDVTIPLVKNQHIYYTFTSIYLALGLLLCYLGFKR